ncbi:hypothetical protein D3C71_1172680 [compost metagenome]
MPLGTPLQRRASCRLACSWSSRPFNASCTCFRPVATLRPRNPMRTGKVLMNMPTARSTSAPPRMRPNNSVPNTTSSWPVVRASTSDQARWNTADGLTPWLRANARMAFAWPASRLSIYSCALLPSACTSSRPNGAVGSSTSASMAEKNCRCASGVTPSRACATKSRNGTGSGKASRWPARTSATSALISSSVVWSMIK